MPKSFLHFGGSGWRQDRVSKDLCLLMQLAGIDTTQWQLGIRMVGPQAMRRLNGRLRGKWRPTDILSLKYNSMQPNDFSSKTKASDGHSVLGELVFCWPTIIQRVCCSQRTGVNVEKVNQRFIRLAVHGLCHLMGHDHDTGPRDLARMQRLENQMLRGFYAQRRQLEWRVPNWQRSVRGIVAKRRGGRPRPLLHYIRHN